MVGLPSRFRRHAKGQIDERFSLFRTYEVWTGVSMPAWSGEAAGLAQVAVDITRVQESADGLRQRDHELGLQGRSVVATVRGGLPRRSETQQARSSTTRPISLALPAILSLSALPQGAGSRGSGIAPPVAFRCGSGMVQGSGFVLVVHSGASPRSEPGTLSGRSRPHLAPGDTDPALGQGQRGKPGVNVVGVRCLGARSPQRPPLHRA
jgi:hypothetical protein